MTSEQAHTVADGQVVSLAYKLHADDGELLDESEVNEPLAFLQGAGQIIPGLETALYGMSVGDKKNVKVEPVDGYGKYNPENKQTMPRTAFPPDLALEEGTGLVVRDTQSGERFQAFVEELHQDHVVLDFNHPLAGETLFFEVEVVGLRPATAEELAHGHAH